MSAAAVAGLLLALGQAPSGAPARVLSLQEAFSLAERQSEDLKVVQARLEQSQLISRKAWAAHLPQLSAGASYTRNDVEAKFSLPTSFFLRDIGTPSQNGPPFDPSQPIGPANPPGVPSNTILFPAGFQEIVIQKRDQLGAQLQLVQPLIVPALWPAIRNSYLAEEVAQLTVENARREIFFAVAQLYYGAVSLKEFVGVQEKLLEANRAHEKDAQVRVAAGAIPRIGLVRAQIDRARTEQDLLRAQKSLESAKVALAGLLAIEPGFDVARPAEPALPEESAEALVSKAGERRPDVQAARKGAELAGKANTATWYKYFPSVVATGVYRYANVEGFTGKTTTWAIMLGANWVLWDGGQREIELKETAAKRREAQASERAAARRARDEVQRAMLDLESARANRQKAEEQLKLARENAELINVNYSAGAATQLEVTDATTALANAEIGAVAETLNAQLASIRLLKAAGLFDPGE